MVDYDKGQLWSKVPQDNGSKFLEIRTPITVGIPGHVASTGQYLNISETATHPLFSPELEKQMGYKIHNILCMPVVSSKNQVVAVVQLAGRYRSQWKELSVAGILHQARSGRTAGQWRSAARCARYSFLSRQYLPSGIGAVPPRFFRQRLFIS